jgi:hypothetical protein
MMASIASARSSQVITNKAFSRVHPGELIFVEMFIIIGFV